MDNLSEHLRDRLLKIPEEIKELRKKELKALERIDELVEDIKIWENDQWMEIYEDKSLSNEKHRQVEMVNRKTYKEEYLTMKKTLETQTNKRKNIVIDYSALDEEQKNLRAICYLNFDKNRII